MFQDQLSTLSNRPLSTIEANDWSKSIPEADDTASTAQDLLGRHGPELLRTYNGPTVDFMQEVRIVSSSFRAKTWRDARTSCPIFTCS